MTHFKREIYFSARTGKVSWDRNTVFRFVKNEFSSLHTKLSREGYFQKYFGIDCILGYIHGEFGSFINTRQKVSFLLKKENLWPVWDKIVNYTEDDFFDIVELLYDYCSKPVTSYFCTDCFDAHYKGFDDKSGQSLFRVEVNKILSRLDHELSEEGQIVALPDEGFSPLLEASVPPLKDEGLKAKETIDSAIRKFRGRHAGLEDKKDAVRDLARILEHLGAVVTRSEPR